MKTRNGFVSNSSSSSFVIGLKKTPKTWQELHEVLFDSMVTRQFRPDWVKPTDDIYAEYLETSATIAENIFNQIADQTPLQDSQLEKCCAPDKYPDYPDSKKTPEGKKLAKHMLDKYGVGFAYALSPTNVVSKKLGKIARVLGKQYDAECARNSKEAWTKQAPKFKGLKKFVIMTQTDGGKESRVLAFMEYCWKDITKNVVSVKLTSH